VARETVERTLGAVMPEVVDAVKQAAIASAPNPMLAMMTQAMQPMLQQAMGGMMGMFRPPAGGQPGQQPPVAKPNIDSHCWEMSIDY
ncbi:unnamed protein product, partial [marine sediment metagenome]